MNDDYLADAAAIEAGVWYVEMHPDERVRAARRAVMEAREAMRRAHAAVEMAEAELRVAEAAYDVEQAGLALLQHAQRAD